MNDENKYTQRLKNLEEDYIQEKIALEKQEEQIFHEKKQFILAMDDMIERARYILIQREAYHAQELSNVYHLVEQAQEEGLNLVKKEVQKLEFEAEEIQQEYKKKVAVFEEERLTAINKGRTEVKND